MSITVDQIEKYPTEKFAITVDFSAVIGANTILTNSVTSSISGVDSTATIIDSSSHSSSIVTLTLKGGLALQVHNILVTITSSDSSIWQKVINLYVLETK